MDIEQFQSATTPGELVNSDGRMAFKPAPLPPTIDIEGELFDVFTEATTNVGQLSGIGRRVENPSMLISPFIYKEAVISSEIEGTRVTLSDVYEYEAGRNDPDGPNRNELLEVHNYVKAVFQGIKEMENGIDLNLVRTLHNTLMSGVRGENKQPGDFRDTQVYIGGRGEDARFVPPPPSVVPYAMQNLETYLQTGGTYHPLVDLGLVHYQFETVHPFRDGNGRMGRLLIMLMMCERGLLPEPYLYPSSYFNRNREEYTDRLLAVSRDGAWKAWLIFFLKGISRQAQEAFSRASELLDLRDEYRDIYQDEANSVSQLAEEVFTKPYLTVNEAEEILDMSYQAANKAVGRLEDDGVLEEITGRSRNRVFRAKEVFKVIEKPVDELKYSL
ncbi:Fic family protein [Halorussus lipolyticus]|uniref:Fic family protein n=1 Tax=Halorussus lipolyticus TaxID=3034024 RepID=UPI0023E89568|nr:Fic family protein [Halorussus sp. DT80]